MRTTLIAVLSAICVSVALGGDDDDDIHPFNFQRHIYIVPEMCTPDARELGWDDQVMIESQRQTEPSYKTNVSCTLKFKTTSPNLGLLVAFQFVDTYSCQDYLTVKSYKLGSQTYCGPMKPHNFLVSNNETVKVKWTVPEHAEKTLKGHGFRTVLTAYQLKCKENQTCFKCDNEYYINPNVICNGFDNCGDYSDESGCIHPTPPSSLSVWMILFIVLSIVVVAASVALSYFGTKVRKELIELRARNVDGEARHRLNSHEDHP